MLDYEKLFEPYQNADPQLKLENSLRWLFKHCEIMNIPQEIAELAIQEVFTEVANGREFPMDYCPCGCGIDKPGTAITHEFLKRAMAIDQKTQIQRTKLLSDRHKLALQVYISGQRKNRLKRWIRNKWNGLVRYNKFGGVSDTNTDGS